MIPDSVAGLDPLIRLIGAALAAKAEALIAELIAFRKVPTHAAEIKVTATAEDLSDWLSETGADISPEAIIAAANDVITRAAPDTPMPSFVPPPQIKRQTNYMRKKLAAEAAARQSHLAASAPRPTEHRA